MASKIVFEAQWRQVTASITDDAPCKFHEDRRNGYSVQRWKILKAFIAKLRV